MTELAPRRFRAAPSRPGSPARAVQVRTRLGVLLLACLSALAAAGCDNFLDQVQATSDKLDRWAVDSGLVPGTPGAAGTASQDEQPSEAELAYREGLKAQRAGRFEEAAVRFRTAAEAGHPAAAYELSEAYRRGDGVTGDPDAAAEWQAKAAEWGEPRAQYLLGAAYSQGLGVERDDEQALYWLGLAATQGHAPAQYLLAEAFANGRGVEADIVWAARWYGKAARQGHLEAQFAYGLMFATGNGLPQHLPTALTWLTIAARKGHGPAEEGRRALASVLEPDQVAASEARAGRFVPGPNQRFADPPTVIYVQYRLNALGFQTGTVDGIVGPRTRSGIRDFQSARGRPVSGQVTPDLLTALLEES